MLEHKAFEVDFRRGQLVNDKEIEDIPLQGIYILGSQSEEDMR